jgi:hypothetical protein
MNIDGFLDCFCENDTARALEYELRKVLYRRKYFRADTLFQPFHSAPMAYDSTDIGIKVQEDVLRTDNTNNIVFHDYIDVLEDEESVEEIKIPTFTARPQRYGAYSNTKRSIEEKKRETLRKEVVSLRLF